MSFGKRSLYLAPVARLSPVRHEAAALGRCLFLVPLSQQRCCSFGYPDFSQSRSSGLATCELALRRHCAVVRPGMGVGIDDVRLCLWPDNNGLSDFRFVLRALLGTDPRLAVRCFRGRILVVGHQPGATCSLGLAGGGEELDVFAAPCSLCDYHHCRGAEKPTLKLFWRSSHYRDRGAATASTLIPAALSKFPVP